MTTQGTCSVECCDLPVRAKKLCASHYQRQRDGQSLDTPIRRQKRGALCSVEACDRKANGGLGMCGMHYQRQSRGAPLSGRPKPDLKLCTVVGCGRVQVARGYCNLHWKRNRAGIDLDAPAREVFQTRDLEERLRHYAPASAPDECWEWTRARNKGYGMMAVGQGKLRGAHIVAWEIANGRDLPEGNLIRHSCDNPPCTNPAHLLLGTGADNVNDKIERGRYVASSGYRFRTAEEIREIRELFAAGESKAELARRYGCTAATIMRIVNRASFSDGTERRHTARKLNEDQVREIRALAESGVTQQNIADQFGIHQSTVSAIVARKVWGHVM